MRAIAAAILGDLAVVAAMPAGADPRLGTKACLVESAFAFEVKSGSVGDWSNAQRSFVLNVYDCDDALGRGIDFGAAYICENGSLGGRLMAIKTSIKDHEQLWEEAASVDRDKLIPAEFRSFLAADATYSRAIFRLSADLRFVFWNLDAPSGGGNEMLFTMTGTCADFQ